MLQILICERSVRSQLVSSICASLLMPLTHNKTLIVKPFYEIENHVMKQMRNCDIYGNFSLVQLSGSGQVNPQGFLHNM